MLITVFAAGFIIAWAIKPGRSNTSGKKPSDDGE